MKAEIIAVGSELLTPYRQDTNSLYLTERLNRLGIEVIRKSIVGDDRARLREAFEQALARADLVISIGGLGPTEDDLTREAVAELLGRKLKRDENILREIQARFRRYGRKMAAINERQALVPEGAAPLANPNGTAPGLWLEAGGRIVVLLPGPPPELIPMFRDHVEPRLAALVGAAGLASRELRVTGMPEADLDQLIAPIYTLYPDVQTTVLAAPGEIQVHLRAWTRDRGAAERTLDEMVERLVLALGENVFTTAGEALEEVVARLLNVHGATIAVAESCTGGLVAARLTNVPGSSSYLLGGVVCYSNELKSAWLDVPAELIAAKGPVSAEVTAALAENVRRRSAAKLGLAVTGIAGPGGTAEIPAGTVHIALANGEATKSRAARFPGDRERVRAQAAQMALDTVRRYFLYQGRKG
jgi:nicotinamide-nucleotide amidase